MTKEFLYNELDNYNPFDFVSKQEKFHCKQSMKIVKKLIEDILDYVINDMYWYTKAYPGGVIILMWWYRYYYFELKIYPSKPDIFRIAGGGDFSNSH